MSHHESTKLGVESRLKELFSAWLHIGEDEVSLTAPGPDADAFDLVLEACNYSFLIQLRRSGTLPSVEKAAQRLAEDPNLANSDADAIPLLVVNYLTPKGRQICRERGVSWVDLSGNAHIDSGSLLIHSEGKANQFKRKTFSNAFGSKGSRVARLLLMHPSEWFLQKDISDATGLSEGYISRIVRSLAQNELVERKPEGRTNKIRVQDPELLLDTWREHYDFQDHRLIKGTVPARSGDQLVHKIAEVLDEVSMEVAATGLAGAWLYDQFASFRITTFYIAQPPNQSVKSALGFMEEEPGANTWFVVPNDRGVFDGKSPVRGISCVHPVQVFLDLKGHPERANEAASHLRQQHLEWK